MRGIEAEPGPGRPGRGRPGGLGQRVRRSDRQRDGHRRRPPSSTPWTGDRGRRRPSPSTAPERLNWHFIPRPRKGLPIKEMTPAQRALAFGLIRTGRRRSGFLKATTIMSLEEILRELEKGRGPGPRPRALLLLDLRHALRPGPLGLAGRGAPPLAQLHARRRQVVAATPAFFGANPAEVRQGPRKGLRTLADVEDRALRLVQALDDDQQKQAVVADEAPKDIRAANTPQPPTDAAEGIAYADLNDDQRQMLRALIEAYAADMPAEVADAWLDEIKRGRPRASASPGPGPPTATSPTPTASRGRPS